MIKSKLQEIYFALIIKCVLPILNILEKWQMSISRYMASFHKPFQILLNFAAVLFCLSSLLTFHKTPDITIRNSKIMKKTIPGKIFH
jgi:hypothetical protein